MSLHGTPLWFLRINKHNHSAFEQIRQRVAGTQPSAFGPAFSDLSADSWESYISNWSSNRAYGLIADMRAGVCGFVVGVNDEQDAQRVNLAGEARRFLFRAAPAF